MAYFFKLESMEKATKVSWNHFKRPLLVFYISFTGNIDKTSKILLKYFNYDTITLLS